MNLSVSVPPIILEPDNDQTTSIDVCFQTYVNGTLLRDAVFELQFINGSAALGVDVITYSLPANITVPAGHRGLFSECYTLSVIGDNEREENEDIIFAFRAFNEMDSVYIPLSVQFGADGIRIVIYDNDGVYIRILSFSSQSDSFMRVSRPFPSPLMRPG